MTDLAILSQTLSLTESDAESLQRVTTALPAVQQELSVIGGRSKTDLQLETVDVADLHPMRSLRHTLAQIQRRLDALQEASFERRIKLAEIDEWREKDTALSRIKAEQMQAQVRSMELAMIGAVRDLAALCKLRNELLEAMDIETMTPEIVEEYEAEAQVMTCLSQCLAAARASPFGLIDHGNYIYCQQLGINGGMVQYHISRYLEAERVVLSQQKSVEFEGEVEFLRKLTDIFADCPLNKRLILGQRSDV
jgi:hypothetical protein